MPRDPVFGWDEAVRRSKWAVEHWEDVVAYVLQRMAMELFESIGPSQHLHLVKVMVPGQDSPLYGISLEPEPERSSLEDLASGLLYFATDEDVALKVTTPFVADKVPEDLVSERVEDGFFYLRDANRDELTEWSSRNQEYLESNNLEAAPLDSKVWFVDDVRYNVVRAEFGFSEREGRAIWRKSLSELKRRKVAQLTREVERAFVEMKFPENPPTFERRSLEWLERNEKAMLILAGR